MNQVKAVCLGAICIGLLAWIFLSNGPYSLLPSTEDLNTQGLGDATPEDQSPNERSLSTLTIPGEIHLLESPESPCLVELIETNDFSEYLLCLRDSGKISTDELFSAFHLALKARGETSEAYFDLLEEVRSILDPSDTIELWRISKRALSKAGSELTIAIETHWVSMPPVSHLELNAFQLISHDLILNSAPRRDVMCLLAGIGSTQDAELRTSALAFIETVIAGSVSSSSSQESRYGLITAAFNLGSDPIESAVSLADLCWWASAQDLQTMVYNISFNSVQRNMPAASFQDAFESLASQHPAAWAELKESGFPGTEFSAEELAYLQGF